MYGNFALAGVHLWVDLDTLDTSIRNVGSTWTLDQLQRYAAARDAFHSYNNTAGFLSETKSSIRRVVLLPHPISKLLWPT